MKIKSINIAALWISGVTTLFFIVLGLVLEVQPLKFLIGIFSLVIITFLTGRYFINRLILYKIKPIYQIMLSRNISSHSMPSEVSQRTDVIKGLEDDLNQWADRKYEEISRLKENERYRKEFLGDVSHELKTPIFNIQGYILTLLDGGLEDKEINRLYLERAERSIDRMINTVNDLEEITTLESGMTKLNYERFDIMSLVREIIDAMEMKAGLRGTTIKLLSQDVSSIEVLADRKRIEQVLVNLISNAIKYGRDNGLVTIKFVDGFDKIIIEVRDNGVGISKENLPRLFERFYRIDRSRSREQGGTGLGLAIVKHIIEAHGETVTVRSELGAGSTFSFTLSKAVERRNK